EELGRGHIRPAAVGGRDREEREVGGGAHPIHEKVGSVGLRVGRDKGRHVVVVHGNSFGTGQVSPLTLSGRSGYLRRRRSASPAVRARVALSGCPARRGS